LSTGGRAKVRAGLVAVVVGLVALALKSFAAWRTDSLALLADAAESLVNLVAALVATASVTYAGRPAADKHPFGLGKIEFLSAGIEGALVVLAAGLVAFESVVRFGDAPRRGALAYGLGVAILATGANAALARYLDSAGRRMHSAPLLADAHHLRSDVVTSLLVYVGFGVAWLTGWWRLDALLALGVSGHILIAGLRAVRHSVSGLFDESLRADEIAAIEQRLAALAPPVLGCRELKAGRSAGEVEIEIDLVMNRYALLYEAREICDRLEAELAILHPAARISVRAEPESSAPGPA